jgi:hypothetical protein
MDWSERQRVNQGPKQAQNSEFGDKSIIGLFVTIHWYHEASIVPLDTHDTERIKDTWREVVSITLTTGGSH